MVPFVTHSPIGLYAGAHAYVTSAAFRAAAIGKITDVDEYLNIAGNQYAYYSPLAYQLFPDTENKASWGTNYSKLSYISPLLAIFFKLYIRLIGLDVGSEPGFLFAYLAAKSFFALAILFVFLILIGGICLIFILRKIERYIRQLEAAPLAK